jgi:hypothetical protein
MNIAYRDKILMESAEYKGTMYWENYMLTNLVRTVSKDLEAYTAEAVVDMYSLLWGEDAKPLFEDMVENEEALHEAAQIKGTLLFEDVGNKNIEAYLNEISIIRTAAGKVGKLVPAGVKMGAIGDKIGKSGPIGTFIKALWKKLKFLGGGVLGKVGAFLKGGFSWAKDLVQQGAAWVAKTPILNVAVPMLMVMGTAKAAKGLINKLRRKSGGKKMSPEEVQQFDEIAAKNEDKVKKTRQKVLNVA